MHKDSEDEVSSDEIEPKKMHINVDDDTEREKLLCSMYASLHQAVHA